MRLIQLSFFACLGAASPFGPPGGNHGPPHGFPPHGPPHYPYPSQSYSAHSYSTRSWSTVEATGLPTATFASGIVRGTTTTVASATAVVNKYLGVPFAKSPPERFSPPTAAQAWQGVRNATVLPPACIQQFNYPAITREFTMDLFDNPPPASESEDCLYLNIFAPAVAQHSWQWHEGGLPVMVWIYGGALEFGYSGDVIYDGSHFAAEQGVILVSINYRTNVFGFPNSPQVPFGSENLGFLDQRFALEWVQENIARIGGDPRRVTIFGESAGGYSVKQLLALPPQPLTFSAAIMESEATETGVGPTSWTTLVANLSCTDAASQIDCVRAVPATTIKSVIEHLALLFDPVVDNVTNSGNVAQQINAGTFAHVPFMLGTNSQEGRVFEYGQTNITAYLDATFPGAALAALRTAIAAQYPADANAFDVISDIQTNIAFLCPSSTLANLTASKGYDVYRYYYNASFPNTTPLPNLGVYHSSEIPSVFGTYPTAGATAQQIALSNYMNTAWANFAKYHYPGWPRLNSVAASVGDLGGDGSFGEYDITPGSIDEKCGVYAGLIQILGI